MLPIIRYAESSGGLREAYDQLRDRAMPPIYKTPAIVEAHSLDPDLIPKVFLASPTLLGVGPLAWAERELVATLTSRLNECFYCTACHADLLRNALDGDRELPLGVVTTPRKLTASPRHKALAEIAMLVTESPWALSALHRDQAHDAGLDDDDVLHAIMLSAYLGHLNRIADVTGIRLDYTVELEPPLADAMRAALEQAPVAITGRPVIDPARRVATTAGLAAWRSYMFDRDAPIGRRQRTVIARWVALWLGDGGISAPDDLTFNPLDDLLRELAQIVTLAPWKLNAASFEKLRGMGLDDASLFDVCAVTSSAGVFSRITVALAALGRERA